jgi:hypothetical protein
VEDEKLEITPPAISAYKIKSKTFFQTGNPRMLVKIITRMPDIKQER